MVESSTILFLYTVFFNVKSVLLFKFFVVVFNLIKRFVEIQVMICRINNTARNI